MQKPLDKSASNNGLNSAGVKAYTHVVCQVFPVLAKCFSLFFLFFFSNEGIFQSPRINTYSYTPLFIQAFLFAFLSFRFSFLLSQWLVLGASHTQIKSPHRDYQNKELSLTQNGDNFISSVFSCPTSPAAK